MIDLVKRMIVSNDISPQSPLIPAMQTALQNIQDTLNNESYTHPFVGIIQKHGALDAIAGSNELVEQWMRKLNNLPVIGLVNQECKDDTAEVDPLGFFCNTNDLEESLKGYALASQEVQNRISGLERQSYNKNTRSCICIVHNKIIEEADSHKLDYAALIEIVMWHEIGHLVFNPSLHKYIQHTPQTQKEVPHTNLEKGHKVGSKTYKRAKAFQLLVEGLAQYFACAARDVSQNYITEEYKKVFFHMFNKDISDESEYAYHLKLFMLQQSESDTFANILLSFYFNCLQSGIFYHTAPWINEAEDFAEQKHRGKDLVDLSSYPSFILSAMPDRKLELPEFIKCSNASRDIVPFSRLTDDSINAMGIDHSTKPFTLITTINSMTFNYTAATNSNNTFDDYLLPEESETEDDMLAGFRFDGQSGSALVMSNGTFIKDNNGKSIHMGITAHRSIRKELIFAAEPEVPWATEDLRRAAYYTWRR